jgi:16S rRNA (guanine966-N2)-methyltransferase
MRIIAGSLKGRRLQTPAWDGLRPTSDKLRETLFNILAPRIEGARVLDGFAGTGALGIEALSRGARDVMFVDTDSRARTLIADNLAQCGIESGYTVVAGPVSRAIRDARTSPHFVPFDIVLFDPPYDTAPGIVLDDADLALADTGVLVLEHAARQAAPLAAGRLIRQRDVRSGDSTLSFYGLPR